MTNFLPLAALLSIFAWTEGEAGPRSERAASFLALVALVALLLRLGRPRRPFRRGEVLPFLGAVLFAAFFFHATGPTRFFALAASLGLAGLGRSSKDPLARTLPTAALVFAGLLVVRDHLSAWAPISALAEAVSVRVAAAMSEEARWGPTRIGFWTACGGLALAVGGARGVRPGARVRIAACAAGMVLVPPAAVALELLGRRPFAASLPHPAAPLLALLLGMIPLAVLSRAHAGPSRDDAADVDASSARRRRILALTGALVFLGLALLAFSRGDGTKRPRVLLDVRGAFSLEPLLWGVYGAEAAQGASLATLPELLAVYDFPLTRSDSTITSELLSRHDVLLVMNATKEYTPEEREAIWSFVRGGGGLLVLGDHTNILGTGAALQTLLAPVGIRVSFDSAIPAVERWTWYGCLRRHPHPVLRGVEDETDVKVSVGASLALSGDAFPLLSGRDAFSDAGDSTNARGAYLGNMGPDPGERWGDLFLAAEAPYGRGKVIVFGDTSTFQRTAVTHSRELVLRILRYLGTPGHATLPFVVRAAGAMLLLGAGVAFLAAGPGAGSVACLGAVATLALLGMTRLGAAALPEPHTERVAWVDLGHGNRVDVHSGRDDGIGGLCDHLARHGMLPLAMKHFDAKALRGSRAFVTVAPAFPFSRGEREALVRYVNDGGLLLIGTGYEESHGAATLLADFGFSIGSTPLGAAHESRTRIEGTFVMMHESWPVESKSPEDVSVLAEAWDYPLVSLRRVGRGSVLVIGDSRFLGDSMLETPERAIEANIEFLRRAIERALAPATGATS